MRKMPLDFYCDLHAVRDKYGQTEYSRDQILPAVIGLIEKHRKDARQHLLRDAANGILDNVEAQEDRADSDGLFPFDAHAALGKRRRIKRGRMNLDQHLRRKRVIDNNKISQDKAWATETNWLNVGVDALQDMPVKTVREDVLAEDLKVRHKEPA